MNLITKDVLIISGEKVLSIINVNQYNIERKIDVPDSDILIFIVG